MMTYNVYDVQCDDELWCTIFSNLMPFIDFNFVWRLWCTIYHNPCHLRTLFAYPVIVKNCLLSTIFDYVMWIAASKSLDIFIFATKRTLTCKGSATDMVTEPKPISLPSPDGYVCGYEPGSVLNYPQTWDVLPAVSRPGFGVFPSSSRYVPPPAAVWSTRDGMAASHL